MAALRHHSDGDFCSPFLRQKPQILGQTRENLPKGKPGHACCNASAASDDGSDAVNRVQGRRYTMKRFILGIVTVVGLTLAGAATASAQGFGHGGYGHCDVYGGHGGYGYGGGYNGIGLSVGYRGVYGGIGFNSGYSGYNFGPRWHDTSHYHYHPGSYQRHRNHYHYVPGHYDLHRSGHWHR
jgi:hypothetical protein